MPSRHSHRQDPLFRNIEKWDDGYDYIDPTVAPPPPTAGSNLPYYPPPPNRAGPSTKTAKYIPRGEPSSSRARSPPPPYDPYDDPRPRRPRHRSPSPLRRSHTHREPDREREPPSRYAPRPGITTSKTFPVRGDSPPPARDRRPRSPSPRRPRPRARANHSSSPPPTRRHYADHSPARPRRHIDDHSPAPLPRRAKTTHNSPASSTTHPPRTRDPDKAPVVAGSAPRPGITRSRTTAAAGELLANKRFQQAAKAALQAGGMAALRQWKAPGPWAGQKGASVATAALGAAALDAFREASGESGRSATPKGQSGGGGKGNNMGSALGGLIVEQLAKGRGGGSKKGKR